MSTTPIPAPVIRPAGDAALLVTLGTCIDLDTNRRVHRLAGAIAAHRRPGIGATVPGYVALLVHYDPLVLSFGETRAWIAALDTATDVAGQVPRRVEIPVRYGGAGGPDLAFVAAHNRLTPAEVVRIHTSREYPVFLMGFSPGFPYLGGMDPAIAAPRLKSPRTKVPAGSVGIAGEQTGVYPRESPGGWQLIGRTDLPLFDLGREPPFLLAPGDVVTFTAVEILEGAQ